MNRKAPDTIAVMHKQCSFSPGWWGWMLLVFSTLLVSTGTFAQNEPDYDEISVYLTVQRVGSVDISAAIRDEQVYLPINEIFDFLRIRNISSPGFDSISGFFISPKSNFLINYPRHLITFQDKTTEIPEEDMIKSETNLYLKSTYFGQIFGLDCIFNFRGLSVLLETKLELPIIREMRQAEVRNNISRLKGEVKADTTIKRTYPVFHLGMADWSVISNQIVNGRNDTRLNLALGAVVAGGEANASLIWNNNLPFDEKQQQYLWRFANNDFKYVKQILAGKIATSATSSIYSPVVGAQITNTPTTFRRSFGSYTLTDKTEPGWTVELYVNNVLIDYVKADASGFFTFEVPLVYGNSAVLLKFYGPWGEERTKEQNISIPFTFLPAGEMQYSASAGIVEDTSYSRFSRANVNYGVNRRITVGAGTEYLSSVTSGSMMPFVNSSFRIASSLLLTGEYTYGVRKKAILTYRLPSNMQFEMYFTSYDKGQKAINYNYLEERKAVVSMPLRSRNFSAFSRLTLNQIILPQTKYTTAEFLLSGAIYGVSTNLTTYAMFVDAMEPYAYSNLSLSFRLPSGFVLIPQAQYEYKNNKLISVKCGIEKHIFRKGYLNLSYEQNFKSHIQNTEFGFRYDFSFAQTAFTARRVNKNVMLTQSARGGFIYDKPSDYLHASNRNGVGKGGIVIVPFLDLNCNGRREPGEPKADGLNIHINGGRIEKSDRDTTIRIFDLEPYSNFFIEFDRNSFDNISWQIRFKNMNISVDPNQFRLIEVPISVLGEASGMVYLKSAKSIKGLGRVLVCFYDQSGKLAGRTLTESDGYFSFLGLPAGDYTARIDSAQLRKINMVSSPASIPFSLLRSVDGDVFDGIEFTLSSANPVSEDLSKPEKPAEPQKIITAEPIHSASESVKTTADSTGNASDNKSKAGEHTAIPSTKTTTSAQLPTSTVTPADAQKATETKVAQFEQKKDSLVSAKATEVVKQKDLDAISAKKETRDIEAQSPNTERNLLVDELNNKPEEKSKSAQSVRYGVQVGAFVNLENAQMTRSRLVDALHREVFIKEENGLYKVIVNGFTERSSAIEFLPKIKGLGFVESFVIRTR